MNPSREKTEVFENARKIEFFRGLKISGKIFSRRYKLSRDSRESTLGAVKACSFPDVACDWRTKQ